MTISRYVLSGAAALAFLSGHADASPTAQNGVCPGLGTLGSATDCNVEISYGAGGSASTLINNMTPYDGSDDNLIGIINHSGATISTLTFSGSSFAGGLFAFDGDGLQHYDPSAGSDPTGYGGMTSLGQFTSFTNDSTATIGTVVFGTSGIPDGGTAFFSLEGPPSTNVNPTPPPPPVPVPEPASLGLFATSLIGLTYIAHRRRKLG